MRYLVLSDIHSNLEALTAVLRRVRRKKFDRVVILGDLVGYGADPNSTVDKVRHLRRTVIIRGNHDKVCSGLEAGEMFNKVALESARWTEKKLLPRHRRWLRALPRGPVEVDGVLSISHGTPLDEDAYIFGEIEALNMFPFFTTPICFFGHSHFPVVFGLDQESLTTYVPTKNGANGGAYRVKLRQDTRYLINPGSIGQPRDGDNRASFGILDFGRMTMTIYRVAYAYEKTQAKIRAAGLPSPLADRLALGR
ncbi:MAG: metallophosphoesterase family protein [Vicinamibacteria bacterium]